MRFDKRWDEYLADDKFEQERIALAKRFYLLGWRDAKDEQSYWDAMEREGVTKEGKF